MKISIIIALLINLCIGSVDSMNVMPFGLDLRKDVGIEDLITSDLGIPDSFKTFGDNNIQVCYPNKNCYLLINMLYSIEIIKGKYNYLEIGMSKRRILKKLGKTAMIEILPNREFLEYESHDKKGGLYIMTLEFKKRKLTKILIRRENEYCGF